MQSDFDDEGQNEAFSIGRRVVIKDEARPNDFVSGVVCSLPMPSKNQLEQDYVYVILVDFGDDISDGEEPYIRIEVPSSKLKLF